MDPSPGYAQQESRRANSLTWGNARAVFDAVVGEEDDPVVEGNAAEDLGFEVVAFADFYERALGSVLVDPKHAPVDASAIEGCYSCG